MQCAPAIRPEEKRREERRGEWNRKEEKREEEPTSLIELRGGQLTAQDFDRHDEDLLQFARLKREPRLEMELPRHRDGAAKAHEGTLTISIKLAFGTSHRIDPSVHERRRVTQQLLQSSINL